LHGLYYFKTRSEGRIESYNKLKSEAGQPNSKKGAPRYDYKTHKDLLVYSIICSHPERRRTAGDRPGKIPVGV